MTALSPTLDQPHPYPGKLIIVEGIDGSGKSTQLLLLKKWLEAQEHRVFFTEWNSSELVRETTRRGKKRRSLTPTTFSLLHATDFASRHFHHILPPLKAGMLVLADRYIYTAFARDVVRGVAPEWVRKVYHFAVRPDLAFYFRVPIEVAIDRLLTGTRAQPKYYEAGMDLGLSEDPIESFRLFQSRILIEYETLVREYGLIPMDATRSIPEQQEQMRAKVAQALKGYRPKRGTHGRRTQIFWRRFAVPQSSGAHGQTDRDRGH
ncbi:MAG: thymidylate kinase [Nitrospirae bacterium]|nr:MAG: thymidylate kinase [Nitrospirota bacterium]